MLYIYLDQRDLIDLSREGSALRNRVDRLVASGQVQVILSLMHAIETWKHRDSSHRKEVARFADTMHPLWLLNRDYLFEEEARAAIWEWCGATIEMVWSPHAPFGWSARAETQLTHETVYRFCPFRTSPVEAFPQAHGSIPKDAAAAAAFGLSSLVELFDDIPEIPSALLQLHEAYAESQPAARSAGPLNSAKSFVHYVFDKASRDLNSDGRTTVQQLAASLHLRRCPALQTYLQLRSAIHKDASARPAPSEMVDVVHVVALPYVDAFSTDKRIVDYIRRAKIHSDGLPRGRVRTMRPFRLLASAVEWLEATDSSSA